MAPTDMEWSTDRTSLRFKFSKAGRSGGEILVDFELLKTFGLLNIFQAVIDDPLFEVLQLLTGPMRDLPI